MDKKSQFLYQFQAFFVNSNSIPNPFFSIPIPSPIPGIESGIELNSHSIPELTPTLLTVVLAENVKCDIFPSGLVSGTSLVCKITFITVSMRVCE